MTTNERRPADHGAASRQSTGKTTTAIVAPVNDTYAWTGIFLSDGRVISIAWLRGYSGAIASEWRRYR